MVRSRIAYIFFLLSPQPHWYRVVSYTISAYVYGHIAVVVVVFPYYMCCQFLPHVSYFASVSDQWICTRCVVYLEYTRIHSYHSSNVALALSLPCLYKWNTYALYQLRISFFRFLSKLGIQNSNVHILRNGCMRVLVRLSLLFCEFFCLILKLHLISVHS